jgi:hypothetical protein
LLDSLAGFFAGNQTAFIGGLHSLLKNAAGFLAYLNCRLVADERINALGLSHTFTVPRISGWCKRARISRAFIHIPAHRLTSLIPYRSQFAATWSKCSWGGSEGAG